MFAAGHFGQQDRFLLALVGGILKKRQIGRVAQCARLPKRLPAIEPHGAERIRRRELAHGARIDTGAGLECLEVSIRLRTFCDEARGHRGGHPVHLPEPEAHGKAGRAHRLKRVVPGAEIHIRRAHFHPVFARIPHDLRGRVKTHGLRVEQGRTEHIRVMALDPA